MSQERSIVTHSLSSSSKEDEATSNRNDHNLLEYSDPFLITAGIDPEPQYYLQNQNHPTSSDLEELEMEMALYAIAQAENQNQNLSDILDYSFYVDSQFEEMKWFDYLNRNWHKFQESSSNVRRRTENFDSEIASLESWNQDSPPPAKRHKKQSLDEMNLELAIQMSLQDVMTTQKKTVCGVVFRESPAPEPKSSKGKEESREKEIEKEEKESPFLLCLSTTEEEDDYQTLKFLMAFRFSGGMLVPWSEVSFYDFIKKAIPDCKSNTESSCKQKVMKLYDKFLELRAKFRGRKCQEGRDYEMFELGRFIWNRVGSSTDVDPETHGADPGNDASMENQEQNVGRGNGADPEANIDQGAGDPATNADPENGSDLNPGQRGDNAGLEDPGQNVGEGIGDDPTGDREPEATDPEANVNQEHGADPRENMDLG